jgi:hypothetical protein
MVASTGQADGVVHPMPIGVDQFRYLIIRLIRWLIKIGARWSVAPVFPMRPTPCKHQAAEVTGADPD